ncbi:zinc ABC transporter substrate-binding protein [Allorhizobium sp. BGMRC 0089]|uniref:zinc ABC transporter substrate-binding protein n=1 Tax=Allorhizobium sonneratiae TaxID=2934936 RepID=UPI002033AC53|nr:zinc ABC transporter substrate-binding protein [Allorhizobium sonneratiae]MCM2293672.1 zinc ABC transporter substrate-binding protein [Allorhizobium sonneratiae]
MHRPALVLFTLMASMSAAWAAPNVVATIKPVHSIAAAIMQGVGEPSLLVDGANSPHSYSLKPSKARALQTADIVFWIGPQLEAFMSRPLASLNSTTRIVTLSGAPNVRLLPLREGGLFEPDADEDHAGHDDHGEYDMHIWLDPDNAKAMAAAMANALIARDGDHADAYRRNLAAFDTRIDAMDKGIVKQLADLPAKPIIVFHDGYHYFEHHYKLAVTGSISVSPETAPGAERIAEIHDKLKASGAACLFAEPQFPSPIVKVVAEGTPTRTGLLDPLGTEQADGPDLYPALMQDMAKAMADCLKS